MDKEIYLLRHGDTGYSGSYIGSTDVPLSERGEKQLQKVASFLSGVSFSTAISSPLLRCRESVTALQLTCDFEYFDFLREIDFGRWEQKTFNEIASEDPELVSNWVDDADNFTFPQGESMKKFYSRVERARSFMEQADPGNILVVSHGGVIRHLICSLLRVPMEQYLLYDVSFGSISSVRLHQEGAVLTGLNLGGGNV